MAYLDAQYIRRFYLFRKQVCQLLLNLFHATSLFLYLLKTSKISGFLMFSGGIKREKWHEMG